LTKKVLITGGTGFVGYHLAKKFLSKGWEVTSLSKTKPKKEKLLPKINYIFADISKKNSLKKKLKKNFNFVINLAGYVDHKNKKKTISSHYIGCKNIAELFLNKKLQKFIQIGSSVEYGKLKSPHKENFTIKRSYSYYGFAKLSCTKLLLSYYKKYNFPATIVRPYLLYGPRQDINRLIPIVIYNAMLDKSFDCSNGTQYRDFLYIDDFVEALLKVLKNKKTTGEIINIGNGKPILVKKIILKICNFLQLGNPLFGKIKLRKDEVKYLYPDLNKAKKLINWKAKTSIDLGLKKTIKYFRKNVR